MRLRRLGRVAPGITLELLHVLDRHPEVVQVSDHSGSIGLGAQESLLEQLSALDTKSGAGWPPNMAANCWRLRGNGRRLPGVVEVGVQQRHGPLIETLLDMQQDARLFVMGQNYRVDSVGKVHLDHHVERVVRTVERPVLVTADAFQRPEHFMIASTEVPPGARWFRWSPGARC